LFVKKASFFAGECTALIAMLARAVPRFRKKRDALRDCSMLREFLNALARSAAVNGVVADVVSY